MDRKGKDGWAQSYVPGLDTGILISCVWRYLDAIERALAAGDVVLIENLEEILDPVLGPLLGRETIKKGR